MSTLRTALTHILHNLKDKCALDLWMVTRVVDDDWIMLATTDNQYGVAPDNVKIWKDTICTRMANNNGPNIAPRVSQVEMYVDAPIVSQIPINCYIGYPLHDEEGKLIGTLCAIDPKEGNEELYDYTAELIRQVFIIQCLLRQYNELSLLRGIIKNYPELLQKQISHESYSKAFNKLATQFKLELKQVGALLGFIIIDKNIEKTTIYNLKKDIDVKIIEKSLRKQDAVCKLNDNRIIVLLPDTNNRELTKTVVKLFNVLNKEQVHVKIGAHLSKQNEAVEEALQHAQNRMIA